MSNSKISERENKTIASTSKVPCIERNLHVLWRGYYDCRQIAVREDHILGMVFSFMEIKSLKDLRHVCRRWKDAGAAAISKKIKIVLLINGTTYSQSPPKMELILEQIVMTKGAFNHLGRNIGSIKYRSEPILQKSLPYLMNSSSYFPCQNFCLEIIPFNNPTVQNCLTLIGPYIKTLVLRLRIGEYSIKEALDAATAKFMEYLENFLCEKAVNLEKLRFLYSSTSSARASFNVALTNWDLNPKTIFFGKKICLRRLKSFFIGDVFSGKAFRGIMNSAINLKSVALVPKLHPRIVYHYTSYLEYFMENENLHKVSLISHLYFYINSETVPGFEKFLQHKAVFDRLKLKHFGLVDLGHSPTLIDFNRRVGHLIELFLVASSSTLRTFIIVPLQHFGRIEVPKMSKLNSIMFHHYQSFNEFTWTLNRRIFPVGFCAKQSFPVVKTVVVDFGPEELDSGYSTKRHKEFITMFIDSFDRPIWSVKKFEVKCCMGTSWQLPSVTMKLRLSSLFPNALIAIKAHNALALNGYDFCNNDFC